MCHNKRSGTPCLIAHPVLCGMIAGFTAIGVYGVVMAVKKKAKQLMDTAHRAGCACVENVKEAAENVMESGMQMVDRMMPGKSAESEACGDSCDIGDIGGASK